MRRSRIFRRIFRCGPSSDEFSLDLSQFSHIFMSGDPTAVRQRAAGHTNEAAITKFGYLFPFQIFLERSPYLHNVCIRRRALWK